MGLECELVDLEPTPEDLLTVWGHDVSVQNLERFFPQRFVKQEVKSIEPGAVISSIRSAFLEGVKSKKGDCVAFPSQGFRSVGESSVKNVSEATGPLFSNSGPDFSDIIRFPTLSGGLADVVANCGLHGSKGPRTVNDKTEKRPVSEVVFPWALESETRVPFQRKSLNPSPLGDEELRSTSDRLLGWCVGRRRRAPKGDGIAG